MRHRIDILDPRTDLSIEVEAPANERLALNFYADVRVMLRNGMLVRLMQIGTQSSRTLCSDRIENGHPVPDNSCPMCGATHEGEC